VLPVRTSRLSEIGALLHRRYRYGTLARHEKETPLGSAKGGSKDWRTTVYVTRRPGACALRGRTQRSMTSYAIQAILATGVGVRFPSVLPSWPRAGGGRS